MKKFTFSDTGCKCNDCARMYYNERWLKWANGKLPKEPEYPYIDYSR